MNDLILPTSANLPAPLIDAGQKAQISFLEFFTANILNANTRRAYYKASCEFLTWCYELGVVSIPMIQPLHVAAWIEDLGKTLSVPTVKQRLAAIRHLFDWFVVQQVVPVNPTASVRGPKHVVKRGKTPVLEPQETRQLIERIDTTKIVGLRDRVLIGLMVYSFARIGAALSLKVEDIYIQNRRLWVRLSEKGGKQHDMPCHHNLEAWLHEYLDAANLWNDRKGYVFRTIDRYTKELSDRSLPQANAYAMIRRRAAQTGITKPIGNHTFRATGITAYLKNEGSLEIAARMANHASMRTTQLYDRRGDEVSLDEVERIVI
ncbi:tyrosine-type recombinase/integrase [Labrenzia sp. DG1229]|uniref:tyrosine-type recombinase/integrase n=1 Tax=Labrenzia sp. DG1229 TaxID=681847 RepID=UPI00048FC39A|nr:tyrosine-type recombinase/integrase [Labrenzia sp. DG1229]